MELDPATFAQLRTGQPMAFEALIEQFEGPLFRFFFCDHRNHHVAQEQTAETFAQLVRRCPGCGGETINCALLCLRRRAMFNCDECASVRTLQSHWPKPLN